MKKLGKKKTFVLIFAIFAVIFIAVDLILVYTSLERTGIGCGYSRFWRVECMND